MATVPHKVFCVLEFAKIESQVTVQRAFHLKFFIGGRFRRRRRLPIQRLNRLKN
jgi:hypothetical protein